MKFNKTQMSGIRLQRICFDQTGPPATFTKQLAAAIMIFIVHPLLLDTLEIKVKKRRGLEFGWKLGLSINTDFMIQLLIRFNSIWILYDIDSFEIYQVNFILKLCCKLYREPWYIDSFHKLLIDSILMSFSFYSIDYFANISDTSCRKKNLKLWFMI